GYKPRQGSEEKMDSALSLFEIVERRGTNNGQKSDDQMRIMADVIRSRFYCDKTEIFHRPLPRKQFDTRVVRKYTSAELKRMNEKPVLKSTKCSRSIKLDESKNRNVSKNFSQLSENTDKILSDFAAKIGQGLDEVYDSNDVLWDSLHKLKPHLTDENLNACKSK
ncbi:hypothetical protein PENTCL1PPCAC_8946, partial [Pristionchus entomophagus]